MKKEIAIVIISILFCMTLISCKSKKVKDNDYDMDSNLPGIGQDVNVPDELVVDITGAGKNIVNISLSKPEFIHLYEERQTYDKDKESGKEISSQYNYEIELYLKKGNDTKFVMTVNRNGATFTASEKENDKLIQLKNGETFSNWIYQKKIIDFQWLYPGLVEMVDECDNYEVYFINNNENKREALHTKGQNTLSEKLPLDALNGINKMTFETVYDSDNAVELKFGCAGLNGAESKKILLTLGENEEKYIRFDKIIELSEVETAEAFFSNKAYVDRGVGKFVSYKVELGNITYDGQGNRKYEPLKNENGNVYNTVVLSLDRNSLVTYIEYANIKEFLGDYSTYRGYIGENFEEMVYLIAK